ncbi:hypothetical protein ACPDHL_05510, partial [Myroides sp. C15-4]|uniref:hypothetical protein n=1 Tax=Myroides sp. C15-4 TaxID=3400532 RepID=UPI003D2F9895
NLLLIDTSKQTARTAQKTNRTKNEPKRSEGSSNTKTKYKLGEIKNKKQIETNELHKKKEGSNASLFYTKTK